MNDIIKNALDKKETRVYSLIVSTYHEKITEMKTKFFIIWLSSELGIPVEQINLNSFNSALHRYEKRAAKSVVKREKGAVEGPKNNPIPETHFSSAAEFAEKEKKNREDVTPL